MIVHGFPAVGLHGRPGAAFRRDLRMKLEGLPLYCQIVFAGEAVDTRLANETPWSYEIGIDGHTWRHAASMPLAQHFQAKLFISPRPPRLQRAA